MPKLRVHNCSMPLDGYAAGPAQSPEDRLGVGGHRLHDWVFACVEFTPSRSVAHVGLARVGRP
jgi:hypothetical protein